MNVASLELCKELYELSGWAVSDYAYLGGRTDSLRAVDEYGFHREDGDLPAYDLGYLLRKLPSPVVVDNGDEFYLEMSKNDVGEYQVAYKNLGQILYFGSPIGAIPEDAACKLVIKLFQEGILKREDSHGEK